MSFQFDHRSLADEMEIFFLNEEIGAGLPVWLPNGVAIRDSLEAFIRRQENKYGYQRVVSPHLGKASLYERSGHLRAFEANMYPPLKGIDDSNDYYLKPMNCPHHHKIFSALPRSYRQLPLRLAEYGQVYRFENSGSLKGLSRVRGLCQNDAHIYLDPKDAKAEILSVLELHEHCYQQIGLKGYRYRLSKSDPDRPNDFDGAVQNWQQCEQILRECLMEKNLSYVEAIGEAAFYGPKIDVQIKMSHGVEESISSVQLDFNSGEKFDLHFVSDSGAAKSPWIIHRAPLGSHERFVALLLEYFDGVLPGWLAPIQLYLLPIGDDAVKYANDIAHRLVERNIRVHVDQNAGSLSKRILFAHRLRPFSKLVIGEKEISSGKFILQCRQGDKSLEMSQIEEFLAANVLVPG
ncbi:MAG: threonine--tRNA ligase [Bdellovibrionaceae bacterium]|nr:threonine--tRNA ligase [Pseudobdellovibrionaceae bacterium]